ncbi:MAG: copper homeostasis protein CutC [Christensenellales bacterium]|jgi:copper homeostasis protein|nr:copper homeostasis protein CutC [Clostridiales bacterium]
MKKFLVEVCCGSAEDAIRAALGGADRVELCSNLFQGGLTPTLGSVKAVREQSDITLNVMIRPREGGFCYTKTELLTARRDMETFLEYGVDGLVFGFLNEDGTVDVELTHEFVRLAGDVPITFHRAIDVVPDWKKAIDQLADIGVKRVLTSGLAPNVLLALDTVKEMIAYAGDRLIIMPGAGITPLTADKVAEYTGCKEMHVYFTKTLTDKSTMNNRDIFYGSALYPSETNYPVIDSEQVRIITRK